MFFFLIFITSEITKYLYLGIENCNIDGNTAFLDNPIADDSFLICSNYIPNVSPDDLFGFYPNDVDLIIMIVETGDYLGLENLNNYKSVTIQNKNKYNIDITISISSLFIAAPFSIENLIVSNSINIELNAQSFQATNRVIRFITLDGINARAKTIDIQVQQLNINLDNDLILDDSILNVNAPQFQFCGRYTITDDSQVLNEKIVVLDGTNLIYSGKKDYHIFILIYRGIEKVKRKNEIEPKLIIDSLLINLNTDSIIKEFVDAEISNIEIYSELNQKLTLTIDTPSRIYFPVKTVSNINIRSNGKIDINNECVIQVSELIDSSSFSGYTKNGEKLNAIYQIDHKKICYACLFTNDYEFTNHFLDYPIKSFVAKGFDHITIHNSYFKGCTILNNLNLIFGDLNCKVDALLLQGTGKIFDNKNNEQSPEYFKITKKESLYEFQPMKSDVTNFNDLSFFSLDNQLFLKHFEGEDTTFYKFLFDIQVDSIILDEKINIQFECNLILQNKLIIPESSLIIN